MTYCPNVYPSNAADAPAALTLLTSSLPTATVGVEYSTTLTAEGGTTPYTWSIQVGSLPAWATLNTSTGVISGTPDVAGSTSFTPRVTDNVGATDDNGSLVLTAEEASTALAFTTSSLPAGTRGVAYSATLAASGGTAPYTFSDPGATLPTGLSISGTQITGTVNAAFSGTVTLRVTDNVAAFVERSFALTINEVAALAITTTSPLPRGEETVAYSTTLATFGGYGAVTWRVTSGALPTGLSLATSTGVISGTPTTAATYSVNIEAEDSEGRLDEQTFEITIVALGSVEPAHEYFDTLIARADYATGVSLRPIAGRPEFYASGTHAGKRDPYYASQLLRPNLGGFAKSNSIPYYVTYDPGADTDPNAQDAAKAIINPWIEDGTKAVLNGAMDASQTTLTVVSSVGNPPKNSCLKIDNEVVFLLEQISPSRLTVNVTRGWAGTTPASHADGAEVKQSNNSLRNYFSFPVETANGNSYLWTWDFMYTDSYMRKPGEDPWMKNYKQFQFTARSASGTIWQEPSTHFNGWNLAPSPLPEYDSSLHCCYAEWRSYLAEGGPEIFDPAQPNVHPPSVTRRYPLRPQASAFLIFPNRWTRWWVHITQNDADYDTMNVWIADEQQAPVQLYSDISINVHRGTGNPESIGHWWIELNTSDQELFRLDQRDFVSYHRNFVQLDNPPADWSALRTKPSRGV